MKTILFFSLSCISYSLFAQPIFQLAPPLLKYAGVFFANKTTVEMKFAESGTAVHYTLNNAEPTTQDPVYSNPITIKNNFSTVKAKAFGNNFYSSETVAVTFVKAGKAIQSVQQTTPDKKYPGSGTGTLVDNKGGIEQLSSNTWMGYNCDTVTVALQFKKPQKIDKVLFSLLQNESSWIFLPDVVIVDWYDKMANNFKPFAREEFITEMETQGSHCCLQVVTAKNKITTDKILISILVKKSIPAWHPAKGEHAWMFIDEVKVY
jgi:hypothetical protein